VDGTVGELHGHLLHDSFANGLDAWWIKHVRYAQLEAEAQARDVATGLSIPGVGDLVDPVQRRRWLKKLSAHLPARPELRFLYMYLLRGGVLDGAAGWHYCRLLAAYEHLIVLNLARPRSSK
jgi:hypothetical protein